MIHKVAFLLAFGSGLRISEVVNLELRDVYMKERKILVRQGKGNKDRIVPLPKGFRNSHLNYIPLTIGVRALQKAFSSACKRAKLLDTKPTLHFHSLRHGFATQCISEGIKLNHLQAFMGHTNISTTSIYLHSNPKEALKEYEELF